MKQINEQINPVLLQRTQKLAQFTKILHAVLPVECYNHVKVANIRNQTLMLITDSPVWATRLRQLSPQILQFVQKNLPAPDSEDKKSTTIHHLRISTRYQTGTENNTTQQKKNRKKLQVSQKTATLLSQSASSFDDKQLRAALSRLASHAAEHTNKQSKK